MINTSCDSEKWGIEKSRDIALTAPVHNAEPPEDGSPGDKARFVPSTRLPIEKGLQAGIGLAEHLQKNLPSV